MARAIAMLPLALMEILLAVVEGLLGIISGTLAVLRVYLHRDYDYRRWLRRDLADCETILELGCGSNSPILQIGYGKRTMAVDIFKPYVEMHSRQGNYLSCRQANILEMGMPDKQVDAVVICDVLEHLPRETVEKIDLFSMMERCACKKVIIFTPNGFVPNDEVDGDPYQAHVSAWEPGDYINRGYKVVGATGLRYLFGKASLPKYHPYSVGYILGMLSQPLVYWKPKLAWHSYAVKELN